jgi:hypothetical protein
MLHYLWDFRIDHLRDRMFLCSSIAMGALILLPAVAQIQTACAAPCLERVPNAPICQVLLRSWKDGSLNSQFEPHVDAPDACYPQKLNERAPSPRNTRGASHIRVCEGIDCRDRINADHRRPARVTISVGHPSAQQLRPTLSAQRSGPGENPCRNT